MVDFGSLLLAAALSGLCLTVTLGVMWATSRSGYVLTMASGILLLVFHIVAFWMYGKTVSAPWLADVVLALMIAGFFVIHAASLQYLNAPLGHATPIFAGVCGLLAIFAAALGYDGIGFIVGYGVVAVLLAIAGSAFWRHGSQNHVILTVVSLLTSSCSISFFFCAAVLLWNGQWQIGTAPDNWAERINMVVAVVSMTGLGALTMSMESLRARSELITETMTDPLTGLMNRRAFQSIHGGRLFGPFSSVIMFDLDNFKRTNDVFGHPVGDMVLQRFGNVMTRHASKGVDIFRLGGEEFCAVVVRTEPEKARQIAERMCVSFGAEVVSTPLGPLRSTVSAGVASGLQDGIPLDEVVALADAALYAAKRAGRNRVVQYETHSVRVAPVARSA